MEKIEQIEQYARQNHIPVLLKDSAEFLCNYVKENKPKEILEIGTAIGYSGSLMLLSNPCGQLTTIEKDKTSFNIATNNFEKLNLASRVCQMLGDGYEQILRLKDGGKKYDLIFLDGPKGQYLKYYRVLMEMLNSNGTLIVDNVLFRGLVRSNIDVGHKWRAMITKLRIFLNEIETRQDLNTKICEIGDGIAIIKLKK